MIALRLSRVALHVTLGLLICTFVFPWVSAAGRQAHVRRWSAQLLRIFRVRLEILHVDGAAAAASAVGRLPDTTAHVPAAAGVTNSVVVANHVSWLDIFVINTMQPCRFVAKSDIRDWPLLGYLCERAQTIFISRGSPRDVRKTFKNLVASIEQGEQVAFFPEGTTAAQGTLLPFHANLFEAAIDAGVPIQPLALRYLDPQGKVYPGVDYIDDTTFLQSMQVILRGPPIRAQILVLPKIASEGAHRRALALATNHAIGASLGYAAEAAGV